MCIFDYGVRNNDSPAAFGNSLREYLHDASKLKQHIDHSTILHMLDHHFQQNHQIDGVIRARITTMTATQASIADIIRTLQGLTIQYACPSDLLPTTVAASSIPTTTTLTPSQLHAQQQAAQQGLRPASQKPNGSTSNAGARNNERSQTQSSASKFKFCHNFLRTGTCTRRECGFLHVENGEVLRNMGYELPASRFESQTRPDTRPSNQSDRPRPDANPNYRHQGGSMHNTSSNRSDTYHSNYAQSGPDSSQFYAGSHLSQQDLTRTYAPPDFRDSHPSRVDFEEERPRDGMHRPPSPYPQHDTSTSWRQGHQDTRYPYPRSTWMEATSSGYPLNICWSR